jgi:putative SOS response-associated peptidase YedK
MCGRYTLAAGTAELVEAFDVPVPDFEVGPSYNVAPSQQAPVVAQDRHGRRMGLLSWGLVPGWKGAPRKPLINARSESALRRASFREAFERRRCLVPADGFYEWKREGGTKTPYWIRPTIDGVISFAGIWEGHTFAILTMAAAPEVAFVHDRMPVVIAEADRAAWLDRGIDGVGAQALLRAAEAPTFTLRQVSPRVNRAQENDPGLIEAVE